MSAGGILVVFVLKEFKTSPQTPRSCFKEHNPKCIINSWDHNRKIKRGGNGDELRATRARWTAEVLWDGRRTFPICIFMHPRILWIREFLNEGESGEMFLVCVYKRLSKRRSFEVLVLFRSTSDHSRQTHEKPQYVLISVPASPCGACRSALRCGSLGSWSPPSACTRRTCRWCWAAACWLAPPSARSWAESDGGNWSKGSRSAGLRPPADLTTRRERENMFKRFSLWMDSEIYPRIKIKKINIKTHTHTRFYPLEKIEPNCTVRTHRSVANADLRYLTINTIDHSAKNIITSPWNNFQWNRKSGWTYRVAPPPFENSQ